MNDDNKKPNKEKPLEVPGNPVPQQDPLKKAPDESPQNPEPETFPQRREKDVPVPNPTEKPEINDPEITPDMPQDQPESDLLI